MNRIRDILYAICFTGMIMLLAGCAATDRGAFSILDTIPPDVSTAAVPGGKSVVVAVGPVDVPGYIDRAVTVVETAKSMSNVSSVDQEAYVLKTEIPRVLTENLEVLFAPGGITAVPYRHVGEWDFRVVIDLAVFDLAGSDIVETKARWALYGAGKDAPVLAREISLGTPVEHRDSAGVKAAMSKALAEMSRSIARTARPVIEGK